MTFVAKRFAIFLALILCIAGYSTAQNRKVDSLRTMAGGMLEDKKKVRVLLDISRAYWSSEHPELVVKYGEQARDLAEKLDYDSGLAYAYKTIGRGFFDQSLYLEALQHYERSLSIFDSLGDKTGKGNMFSNIGNIYFNQGDETKSLEYFFKSLKLAEEINDTLRVVTALNNIAAVFANKSQTYDRGLEYYLRAYPLSVALQDSNSVGTLAVNIGEIYMRKAEELEKKDPKDEQIRHLNDSALTFFRKSLSAYGDLEDATYTLNDMGQLFKNRNDFDQAIWYHRRAFELAKKSDAQNDMAISLVGLGKAYQRKGETRLALATFQQADTIATATGSIYTLKDVYDGLAQTYSELFDFTHAFKYQNLLISTKDKIYNLETDKKLGGLRFDFEIQKKEGQISLLTKDQQLKEKEISRQKLVRNGFIGGFAIVLLFASIFFKQRNRISKEKKRSDELLLNILPHETAEELKQTGTAKTKSFDLVTVMFTDFKNFTQASEKLTPEELVEEINHCYCAFDNIITRYGIEKIKTIGDAYMCAGGLPVTSTTHPEDVIKAGLEMQEFIRVNKEEREAKGQPFFELRLGIHTGPVVAGIVGIKKFAYDIWGDTVNTASRMESSGEIGKVNISGTTYELVKEKFRCTHRGKVKAKNKGEIDMYFVEGIS